MKILTIVFLFFSALSYGQGVKISDMPDASALGGTEYIPVVQSGANRKATPLQLSTYVNSLYGTGVNTWLTTPSWINFNSAITGTAPYWPLSGNFSTTGNQTIALGGTTIFTLPTPTASVRTFGPKSSATGEFASFAVNENTSGFASSIGIGGTDPNVQSVLYFDPYDIWAHSPSGGGVTFWDDRTVQKGIEYSIPRDSTDWTPHTLTTKAYVDGLFMPLTGTADLTGAVTINGGGTNDLSFGASGSRLDDLSLYADNQALINVASGNDVNRVILQPGLSSFTLLDTDGMTVDVQILVQPGAADILRIVKDQSVTVFEINADGSIVYGAPPTDCTGLESNTIWSDNGTLKLCP